jgi:hypothetical protein
MTTFTPATGVSVLHAAQLLAAHLADRRLPLSASLDVLARQASNSKATVQLRTATVAEVATDLLAWADTLSVVTVAAWRSPDGEWVHLSIASTLSGPEGTVELDVFGGAEYDPGWFADLEPGERQTVSLGNLRTWATSIVATTGSSVLGERGVEG